MLIQGQQETVFKHDLRSPEEPGQPMPDESELLLAARQDLSLFAPIYERYFQRIYLYCLRRVSNPQEAEDLASQTFTRALKGLQGYRGGSVPAWLFRIAHNAVANHLRGRQIQVSIEDAELDFASDAQTPIDRLIQHEETEYLRELVDQLPDEQKNLLILKMVGGLTSKEIGAVVNKSAGAVRIELHRIIKTLRIQYEQTGEESFS